MAQVTIPNTYFKKSAERDYSNPIKAFFREYLQNSKDAGSSSIEFKIYKVNDDTIFECYDNGCGMTEDIINTKLMALGETTKNNKFTGGFGIAKILILFAQIDYKIFTQNLEVIGQGGNYVINHTSDYYTGTKFVVTLDKFMNKYNYDFVNILEEEIQKSWLPDINITVNEKKIKANLKVTKVVYEDDDLRIYQRPLRKDNWGLKYYIYVRVNGLYMFPVYITSSSNKEIIIELQGYSVDYLTTNRDGLKFDKQQKLQGLINDMILNPTSFAKNKTILTKFQGMSSRLSPVLERIRKKVNILVKQKIKDFKEAKEEILREIDDGDFDNKKELKELVSQKISESVPSEKEIDVGIKKAITTTLQIAELKQYDIKFHYYVEKSKGLRGIFKEYHPETMSRKWKKLLDLWANIIGQIMKDNKLDNVTYDVGYVLENSDGRVCSSFRKFSSGISLFLLNPRIYLEEKAIPTVKERKVETILYLTDLACHEITHMLGYEYHNEELSSKETEVKAHTYKSFDIYMNL